MQMEAKTEADSSASVASPSPPHDQPPTRKRPRIDEADRNTIDELKQEENATADAAAATGERQIAPPWGAAGGRCSMGRPVRLFADSLIL